MPIKSLPVELVYEVCSYIQLSEWQALRLTCRELYNISLEAFVDRYFKSIRFTATSNSLRELEEIAKSDIIREQVQELWMIPTVFEDFEDICDFETTDYAVPSNSCQSVKGDELEARYATCSAMIEDNLSLIKSETFSTRLRRCLVSFKNVDSLGLAHYSTAFLLDPRQQKVRFLGWRHLRDKIDFRFSPWGLMNLRERPIAEVSSLALSRLFQALDGCNLKVRKLHTCNADFCGNVSPEIHLAQEQYDSLLSVLDELEDLHVCINFKKFMGFKNPKPHMVLTSRTWLNLIIEVAPHLKKLALSQDYDNHYTFRPYYFRALCKRIEFTQLRELHLHWARVTSDVLKSLITSAKATLTTFTLFAVALADGKFEADDDLDPSATNISDFRRNDSPDDSTDSDFEELQVFLWKPVWDFFRDELSLQKFSITKLTSDGVPIFIQGLDGLAESSEHAVFDSETAGISFREWIDQLTPVPSNGDTYHWRVEHEEWFNKMIPANSSLPNPISCNCKKNEYNRTKPCRFGCDR